VGEGEGGPGCVAWERDREREGVVGA